MQTSTQELVLKALQGVESNITNVGGKIQKLETEVFELKQARSVPPFAESGVKSCNAFSRKVIEEIKRNSELIGKAQNVRLEIKAAGDALTTSDTRVIAPAGVGIPTGNILGVQNALPQRPIPRTSAVEYSRYLATEGAASKQAGEGTAKTAVRPTFSLITETAATIAGWTKVSKQALNDSAELALAIDVTLRRSIGTSLDSFLMSQTWGGAAGLLAHATAFTSATYTALADAVSEGVATMQEAGFAPTAVCMRPADWLAIVTAKASGSGEYLSGSYLAALPENLRGLKVVLSPTVTAGKALVLDASHIELLTVEDLAIEIGTNADDFTKNVRTILAELRVVPTFRAVGAARLITPKPAV